MPAELMGQYPSGWDVEWVAVDRRGRVGIFTTGAVGPVPRVYLTPGVLDTLRDFVWALPERTESVLLTSLPRPDDYVAFARRGLFAFDWADVHRMSERTGLYEQQARPEAPETFDELSWPPELRPILEAVRSAAFDFELQRSVDVTTLECEQGP